MHALVSAARAAANGFIAAALAPSCAVCSVLLNEPLSGCVCSQCWGSIRLITAPVCDRCGDPLPRAAPAAICWTCSGVPSTVARARAVGEYEGALREIVHALKYSGRQSLAPLLAERMREQGRGLLDNADCVVPVPLHWRREYRRGFNQAREIARHLGRPVVDGLIRRRPTRAQVELAANRRRANVEGAFGIRRSWLRSPHFDGRTIVLVDDVSTTGSTLHACAQVLLENGAAEVFALTAARVIKLTSRSQRADSR